MKGKDKTGLLLMAGVVVILMLLIFIVNVQRRTAEREAESIALGSSREESLSESQARSIAESLEAEQSEAQVERTLASCSDPAVEEMVKRFFDARLAADTTALFEIFGRNDPTVQDDSLTEKLTAEGSWVRSIDDIKVYTLSGKDENSLIGIVTYNMNFRRVPTKAPCYMYFYAEKDENGSWHMRENLLKETRDFIDQKFADAGVDQMIEENEEALRQTLAEDADLALLYTAFMNGEIYAEDTDRDPEVKVFDDPADSILIHLEE